MPLKPSLFATKLREYRALNGEFGRMTQDGLAELLGVSVDAIGKYERSVSFIRGDIEPQLSKQLGWNTDLIVACRKDWQARQQQPFTDRFQILDDTLVEKVFDGSWRKASMAAVDLAAAELGPLPPEFGANASVFTPIYETYRDHWAAVMCDAQMVAHWALPFLLPEDERLFRAGKFIEAKMSVDRLHRPILPGTYFGYCPALIIRPGSEAASSLLFAAFVAFLERLAQRDVLLHGIGSVSCSPSGAQLCRDLGMARLGQHRLSSDFEIWQLSGSDIAGSIFGRRSSMLRRRYAEAF